MAVKTRIRTLERFFRKIRDEVRVLFPSNEDGFITALVGIKEKEKYRREDGGYDAMQALSDTARNDWKNERSK